LHKKKIINFTQDEVKAIWDYAKENYIDKGENFGDTIHKVAMDLGLKPQQVIDAISQPKGARTITDRMYRTQYERTKAQRTAKQWATKTESSAVNNFFNTISSPFRGLATLAHGHALLFTHGASNIFDQELLNNF